MQFIIGIGNPKKVYDGTRHNIGFAVIDKLIPRVGSKAQILLVKPRTYVNRTGDAVISLLKKYPLPGGAPGHPDFLFVCDDVNLPFGKMRLRESGSAGGHHGLESVVQAFGSEKFARLRIGVGIENMPRDLTGFVLEKFSELEQNEMEGLLEKAALVCESWITDGLQAARNKLSQLQS